MNINYTSYILYTFVFIVRLISIPNVYFPNLIFISLLNSYSFSCAQDLTWIQWYIFELEHHSDFCLPRTQRDALSMWRSALRCSVRWAIVKEHELGARKMNFLFVVRRLDSLHGSFVGPPPTTWRGMSYAHTCVSYPYN